MKININTGLYFEGRFPGNSSWAEKLKKTPQNTTMDWCHENDRDISTKPAEAELNSEGTLHFIKPTYELFISSFGNFCISSAKSHLLKDNFNWPCQMLCFGCLAGYNYNILESARAGSWHILINANRFHIASFRLIYVSLQFPFDFY